MRLPLQHFVACVYVRQGTVIRVMAFLACGALLIFSGQVFAWDTVVTLTVKPSYPTELDTLYVRADYSGGPFASTKSIKVVGNTINVALVQDGIDFGPNPAFEHQDIIGRVPAGTYSVTITSTAPGDVITTRTQQLLVALAQPRTILRTIEFYNRLLDQYFVTADASEINDLDAGVHAGWIRTGESFNVFAAATLDSVPVCRYYIMPPWGDSHFFSASLQECSYLFFTSFVASLQGYFGPPRYYPETGQAFYVALPDAKTGICPVNFTPVYRLWNQRADAGHRYTTSLALKAQMLALGWIPEGYGPDAVAMCSPS